MATVTVVIPTYNRTRWLRETIDSALAQTFDDLEILIGDNSTNFAVKNVVSTYDDPRITYVRNSEPLGVIGNWLNLIGLAGSDVIATLHDDDFWDPTFLEQTVPHMVAEPDLAMVFSDFWSVDDNGARMNRLTNATSRNTTRATLESKRYDMCCAEGVRLVGALNAPQPAYAAVIRRSVVLDITYPPEIGGLYDIWFSYQVAMRELPVRYVNCRLTSHREHSLTQTRNAPKDSEDYVFSTMIEQNERYPELVADLQRHWASLRWGRATQDLLTEQQVQSQKNFLSAAPHLPPIRRKMANVFGTSGRAWKLAQFAKKLKSLPSRQQ